MDVVPRGVAESGLKNNNYQLAVFIPTDFSAKIVEADNPDPQKLDIQYKINAKRFLIVNFHSKFDFLNLKRLDDQLYSSLYLDLVVHWYFEALFSPY